MNSGDTSTVVAQGPGLYVVIIGAVVTGIGGLVVTGPSGPPAFFAAVVTKVRSLDLRWLGWTVLVLLAAALFAVSYLYPIVIAVEAGIALVIAVVTLLRRPTQRARSMRRAALAIGIFLVPQLTLYAFTGIKHCDSPEDAHPAALGAKDASQVVTELTAHIQDIRVTAVYTAADDPNEMMGCAANAYTSKVNFADARISPVQVLSDDPTGLQLGGAVEVFANNADAVARRDYLGKVTKPVLDLAELDIVKGPILLRLSSPSLPDERGRIA
jgi:hypothetical protein